MKFRINLLPGPDAEESGAVPLHYEGEHLGSIGATIGFWKAFSDEFGDIVDQFDTQAVHVLRTLADAFDDVEENGGRGGRASYDDPSNSEANFAIEIAIGPTIEEAAAMANAIGECEIVEAQSDDDELPPCPESNAAGELVCPCCKHTEFRYVEDIQCWRPVLSAMDGRLNIDGLYKSGEGYDDGENGRLQCANCVAEYALPEQLELTFE